MRTNVAALLLLALLLALSACARSGGTVNVRPPLPGRAPNLLEGLPPSLTTERQLSGEFLESAARPTPPTRSPTPD